MIGWLFSWPPSITEYTVTIVLALAAGWQWGALITRRGERRARIVEQRDLAKLLIGLRDEGRFDGHHVTQDGTQIQDAGVESPSAPRT
jgi:hypothetical protein